MKLKTAAILFATVVAVTGVGMGGAWYAYKNAMIQRDIRSRVMDVQDVLPRLTALAQRAAAPHGGTSPAPSIDQAQLAAIAEMARQARDSALMARLAIGQLQGQAPAAGPAAAPSTAHAGLTA